MMKLDEQEGVSSDAAYKGRPLLRDQVISSRVETLQSLCAKRQSEGLPETRGAWSKPRRTMRQKEPKVNKYSHEHFSLKMKGMCKNTQTHEPAAYQSLMLPGEYSPHRHPLPQLQGQSYRHPLPQNSRDIPHRHPLPQLQGQPHRHHRPWLWSPHST